MALDTETKPWTRADLERLPDDGNRYEVLDGQLLVTPQASPPHQRIALGLAIRIEAFVIGAGIAHVVGPGAVPFGENELQPDVQVIPGPPGGEKWTDLPAPILVVEVLSSSTSRRDFGIKLRAYLDRVMIPTVWIVDHWTREVYVAEPSRALRVEREKLRWSPAGTAEPLVIDLVPFFRAALGT